MRCVIMQPQDIMGKVVIGLLDLKQILQMSRQIQGLLDLALADKHRQIPELGAIFASGRDTGPASVISGTKINATIADVKDTWQGTVGRKMVVGKIKASRGDIRRERSGKERGNKRRRQMRQIW